MDWLEAVLTLGTLGAMAYFALRRRLVPVPRVGRVMRSVPVQRSVSQELVTQVRLIGTFLLSVVRTQQREHTTDEVPQARVGDEDASAVRHGVWWPLLRDATHVMISGGKGSGKTTTARALMCDLAARGVKILLVDPHHRRGEWGNEVRPCAAGRRLEEARAVFAWAIAEIDRRYKLRADDGQDVFEEIAIVVDELDVFTSKRPDVPDDLARLAAQFVAMLGDESRKIGLRLILIVHGTEVENLGLSGIGSKRNNYVRLQLIQGANGWPEPEAQLSVGSRTILVDTTEVASRGRVELTATDLFRVPETLSEAETSVSGIRNTQTDDADEFRNMDFSPFARLIRANVVGETKLLEVAFGVRPGSSQRYIDARRHLKQALGEGEQ